MNYFRNMLLIYIQIAETKLPFIIEHEDQNKVIEILNELNLNELEFDSEYDRIVNLPNIIIELLETLGIQAEFIEYYDDHPIKII